VLICCVSFNLTPICVDDEQLGQLSHYVKEMEEQIQAHKGSYTKQTVSRCMIPPSHPYVYHMHN
jgi:hypothetical protein